MIEYERVPAGEQAAIDEILRLTLEELKHDNPPGTKPVKRDAHAKHHGVVRAELTVLDGLAPDLAIGVFAHPRTYRAYVRFSNSVATVGSDKEPQGRGLALKLMGVEGEKLLESEMTEKTQDFIMITHPVFPIKDVFDYILLLRAAFAKKPLKFFFLGFNPFAWKWREFFIVNAIRNKRVSNLLTTQFWSTTPYLLDERAVRYSLKPHDSTEEPIGSSHDYLREALVRTLGQRDASYDFLIQHHSGDPSIIEDPREPWDGPWTKVATLKIHKQKFDSPKQMEFAENLSFTPWHSLAVHRPLGGVNRARKKLYEEISKYRHAQNGVARTEPTGDEEF
jgi:hypothetical protein